MTHPTPSLSQRAEQAFVASLLQDPSWLERHRLTLSADRFTDPTYAAIFRGLAEQTAYGGPSRTDNLSAQLADRLNLPRVDAAYLRNLAVSGPDPADIAVYARMVQEAFVRRQLAAQAERIAVSAGPVRGIDARLDNLDRLARAVARLAPPEVEVQASTVSGTTTAEAVYPATADSRQWREDQVLADLLQNGEQAVEVEVWLAADTFEEGPRREVYEAIVTTAEQGEPVTELTVSWELSRQSSTEGLAYDDSMDAYLSRLVATEVVVGAAVEVGRELLVDTLRADLAVEASRFVAGAKLGEQVGLPTGAVAGGFRPRAPEPEVQQHPAPSALQLPPVQPMPDNQPKIRP